MVTRRTRTASAPRRKRVWAREQAVLSGVGATGTVNDLATGFITDMGTMHLPPGITIGGLMMDITASRVAAGTDVTTSQLQVGVIVADESTLAEVPRPLDEPHADWMWFQQIAFPSVAAGTSVSTFAVMGEPLKVRARRRAEEVNQHLYVVFQGWDPAPTFDVAYTSSALLLLP